MAQFEVADYTGTLFFNHPKRTPKSPDWTGKVKIDGKMYFLSGWGQGDGKRIALRLRPWVDKSAESNLRPTQQELPTERHTGYNEWARDEYTVIGKDK